MLNVRKFFIYFGVVLAVLLAVVTLLLTVAVARTLLLEENVDYIKVETETFKPKDEEFDRYVDIFGRSLRYQTVSTDPGKYNKEELTKLKDFLFQSYPLVFNNSLIKVEVVNEFSLLLTIQGSDSSLKPYLLTAHMDVVPVDPAQWSLPPFLGEVVTDPETGDPTIWGRGALDNKNAVIGILSALDLLFINNWKPLRTFYVGFGHDEEVTGKDGASQIAKILSEKEAQIDFLLDEGLPISEGVIEGVDSPVAIVCVTEKGRMEVKITAKGEGGHSSIPPKEQATNVLSRAIANLYRYPQPAMFGSGPEKDMFINLAPKANWPHKLLFSNIWLFGPLLSYVMSRKRTSDAMLRTTTAVTMINAGLKTNVIPATASAHINHRVHPSQSLKDVLAHDISVIGDSNVKVDLIEGVEPHPVSPYGPNSIPFSLITGAIKHAYPDAVTVPGIMIANSDSRHYLNLTGNIYRLMPFILGSSRVNQIHSSNENITPKIFLGGVHFYFTFIRNSEAIIPTDKN